MTFSIETDLQQIIKIHSHIFREPFPIESYHRKEEKNREILLPVGFYNNDTIVGYCVVTCCTNTKTLRAWLGGVLPSFRMRGYFSSFYGWLIDYAQKHKYRYIKANTDNYKPAMIKMLVDYGFDIVEISETPYGDKRKICMELEVHEPESLRISITNSCNLNCFFCHHEGISIKQEAEIPIPELERLLIQAKKRQVAEITVTGGEPLMCPEIVSYILKECGRWAKSPLIKLITNGMLLWEDTAKALAKYSGEVKVHMSLHSLEASIAEIIEGRNFCMECAKSTLVLLNQYNIPLRISCTVLNGLNHTPIQMRNIIDFAFMYHVQDVQFMELLVTNAQKSLHRYYLSAPQIIRSLETVLSENYRICETKQGLKKNIWYIQSLKTNQKLTGSWYRLSCRCGCENCTAQNDISVGSDLRCYPCYLQSNITCGNAADSLQNAIWQRDQFIRKQDANFAKRHLFWGFDNDNTNQ